jgi:hypothetical protein
MKALTKLYDENPKIKEIDLSSHLLRDVDDVFSALSKFIYLEIVSSLNNYSKMLFFEINFLGKLKQQLTN